MPDDGLPEITPEKLAALGVKGQPVVAASRSTWLAVHGALCLALRRPQFQGETRAAITAFVHGLGKHLVAWGALTPAELRIVEITESPHGDDR